jgi:copper resistance protein C
MNTKTLALLTLTTGILLTVSATTSWSHARLKSASPPADATAQTGLKEIKLEFNEAVEPSLSTIEVDDANGQVIATSKGKAVCEKKTCSLAVDPMMAGDYVVKYHVLSSDGHVVDGHYGFHVAD